MNYLAIALVIVIIIILYYVFSYFTNTALIAGLQPLNTVMSWPAEKLTNPGANKYSYQCWLFITGGSGYIIKRGDNTTANVPSVKYDGNNTLTIKDNSSKIYMTITDNFPTNKWVYLAINIDQSNSIEAYINGRLVKTVKPTRVNQPSITASLTAGDNGLRGYLTQLYRLPELLDAQTIQNNYLSGNGLNNWVSSVFPYGMNLTITSAESASRVINVFPPK